jgi:hypothetical protein
MKLPIEIVNKIMVYIAELNHTTIITQYNLLDNGEHYIINKKSDLLWDIESVIFMKRIYPFPFLDPNKFINYSPTTKNNRILMKHGKAHYKEKLRNEKM